LMSVHNKFSTSNMDFKRAFAIISRLDETFCTYDTYSSDKTSAMLVVLAYAIGRENFANVFSRIAFAESTIAKIGTIFDRYIVVRSCKK